MGTKVFFFRNLNEDSSSWSSCYGDNLITNDSQYYNGQLVSSYHVRDIDALKQRMIEHEAIFRSQLYELHRLYRIQKNLMEEIKRNESHSLRVSTEPASSSSLRGYQSPLIDSGHGRTSASSVGFRNFPASCTEEYNTGLTGLPTLKEYKPLDSRPSKKARKNLFDLRIPADEYTDNIIELADLNEPVQIEEETAVSSSITFLGHGSVVNVSPHELTGFSYRNCCSVNYLCREDKKQATIGIDLNEVVDLTVMDEKDEGEASPCWQPPHTKEAVVSSGIIETEAINKVMGVPIFETNALGNDQLIVLPTETSVCFLPVQGNDDVRNEQGRMIDTNLECEPDDDVADEDEPMIEKQNQANVGAFRNQIDLNSCANDIDDPCVLSFGSNITTVKRIFEIDLEAPPPLQESEDDLAGPFKESKNEPMHGEFLQNAAEIIHSMSSLCPQAQVEDNINQLPSETSLSESLLWFVDIASSYTNKLENTNKEIDYFEAMTLRLQEMKEEEHLFRPFIPESREIKETTTKVSLFARSRRGRRRKDFQRDILPGLATLSRHEVTKDLRTFC